MRTRLTLPMRFTTEKRATGFIRDNGLFGIGAQSLELPGAEGSRWRVIIDTARPDAVASYLSQQLMPGVQWARSELAP
jgi:hypothetical protein